MCFVFEIQSDKSIKIDILLHISKSSEDTNFKFGPWYSYERIDYQDQLEVSV